MFECAEKVLRGLPTRGIGDFPVFPGQNGQAVSRDTCQVWLGRAKDRLVASAPEADRAALRKRLDRGGFHALKRSKVHEREFRALPPAVQPAYVGTDCRTLMKVCDNVTPEDQRAAFEEVQTNKLPATTREEN